LWECWENAGIPGYEARRGAEIALAVLARTSKPAPESFTGAETPEAIAAAIILENYDTSDFRKILGVNRFDDVIWFNKEAFEKCISLAPFFLSLEGNAVFGKSRRKHIGTIAAVTKAFNLAKEASGYRLEELLVILSAEKSKSPKGKK
jgi:hypothetical protein